MERLNISHHKPLVFVHLPKAAGTSLLRQMQGALGETLRLDYDARPLTPASDSIASPLEPHVIGVYGHFKPGRYDHLQAAVRCTILRHPVDNLISIYYFWKTLARPDNAIHKRFLEESPGIETFATYPGIQRLFSETYFGKYDMNRFDFIGFYERLDDDLDALANIIGVKLSSKIHVNKTQTGDDERAELLADEAKLQKVASHLRDDIAFYERMKSERSV